MKFDSSPGLHGRGFSIRIAMRQACPHLIVGEHDWAFRFVRFVSPDKPAEATGVLITDADDSMNHADVSFFLLTLHTGNGSPGEMAKGTPDESGETKVESL